MTWIFPLAITLILWYSSHYYFTKYGKEPTIDEQTGQEIEDENVWAVDVTTMLLALISWGVWAYYTYL